MIDKLNGLIYIHQILKQRMTEMEALDIVSPSKPSHQYLGENTNNFMAPRSRIFIACRIFFVSASSCVLFRMLKSPCAEAISVRLATTHVVIFRTVRTSWYADTRFGTFDPFYGLTITYPTGKQNENWTTRSYDIIDFQLY